MYSLKKSHWLPAPPKLPGHTTLLKEGLRALLVLMLVHSLVSPSSLPALAWNSDSLLIPDPVTIRHPCKEPLLWSASIPHSRCLFGIWDPWKICCCPFQPGQSAAWSTEVPPVPLGTLGRGLRAGGLSLQQSRSHRLSICLNHCNFNFCEPFLPELPALHCAVPEIRTPVPLLLLLPLAAVILPQNLWGEDLQEMFVLASAELVQHPEKGRWDPPALQNSSWSSVNESPVIIYCWHLHHLSEAAPGSENPCFQGMSLSPCRAVEELCSRRGAQNAKPQHSGLWR